MYICLKIQQWHLFSFLVNEAKKSKTHKAWRGKLNSNIAGLVRLEFGVKEHIPYTFS